MKQHWLSRLLAIALVFALLCSIAPPVRGANETAVRFEQVDNSLVTGTISQGQKMEEEEAPYSDTQMVRVSIVMEKAPAIRQGFQTMEATAHYRAGLEREQEALTQRISKEVLDGKELDVVWNLSLVTNRISANVPYGKIAQIGAMPGVEKVELETQYLPDVYAVGGDAQPESVISTQMTGANRAWESGYTGVGTRIAVIDTGIDLDHQSFDSYAFQYALELDAEAQDMDLESYMEAYDFLTAAEINRVLPQLHVLERVGDVTGRELYRNRKTAFAFNYIDRSLEVTHDQDTAGEHGSHVAGIAAANRYILQDGQYVEAADAVGVVGNAPDAQLLIMKVFGASGGAYDSDYMAAMEDAIVLGADSINLSLGSASPGFATSVGYQDVMDELAETDTVVTISMGNTGMWAEHAENPMGLLYSSDVSMDTAGAPGTFTNSLAVASVDNDGIYGPYFEANGERYVYTENVQYQNAMVTLDRSEDGSGTEYDFVLIDGYGLPDDYVGVDLTGKIAVCSRGNISFLEKATTTATLGAAATVIYNNEPSTIYMDLSEYTGRVPVVSITQLEGALLKESAERQETADGVVYYTGKLTVYRQKSANIWNSGVLNMSSFSSWGVPGDLSMKPEIAAPGGSIYSVDGSFVDQTDQYELMSGTSMAAPQVAGMAALMQQYVQEKGLSQENLTDRALIQSLLMSTAKPMLAWQEDGSTGYYSILQQGAGLAAVDSAIHADAYVLVEGQPDGKVKVELGDDPDRTGDYSFRYTLHNLTQTEQKYHLWGEVFTQAIVQGPLSQEGDETAEYLSTATTPLDAKISFSVGGEAVEPARSMENYDFDGDGDTDRDDAQRLLDHLVQGCELSANEDHRDVDGNGQVNTRDVQHLLALLQNGTVTLPAGGEVTVDVHFTLTDAQKVELDANYPTGAYVQAYFFAEPQADAEGRLAATHSIPVLGFYGNWSDPSMFEVGSYAEYLTGQMEKTPYLGNEVVNHLGAVYGNEPGAVYLFGGNPLIPDEAYFPERNAINASRGDELRSWRFSAIRNAGAAVFQARDGESGKILKERDFGRVVAPYYVVSEYGGGWWENTATTVRINWRPSNLEEGRRVELSLTLAPEYYLRDDGTVDFDSLGSGATQTIPVVIDNTAPELERVTLSLLDGVLDVTARDNQYIAAAALFNSAGTSVLTAQGAAADAKAGQSQSFQLPLDGLHGNRFLLQVTDYALNTTTYVLDVPLGEQPEAPHIYAFDLTKHVWIGFNKEDGRKDAQELVASDLNFYAAADVGGRVFASTDTGDLYVLDRNDLSRMTFVRNLGYVVTDMAYNAGNQTLYGVCDSVLLEIDTSYGTVQELGVIGSKPEGMPAFHTTILACDDQGNFYCSNDQGTYGYLYRFTLETMASPQQVSTEYIMYSQETQSMEWDPNTGTVLWAKYFVLHLFGGEIFWAELYEIDPATGKTYTYSDWKQCQRTAMYIPRGMAAENPTEPAGSVFLSESSTYVMQGYTKQLTGSVLPWNAEDRTLIWSSSKPDVATVDETGLVTGLKTGVTEITASAASDPSVKASCTVEVRAMDVQLEGVVRENGTDRFFTWNPETDERWIPGAQLDFSVTSAAYDGINGDVYLMDRDTGSWAMHKMDRATGESLVTSGPNGATVPMWDMCWMSCFSSQEHPMLMGIYANYLMIPCDPMNLLPDFYDMEADLARFGATAMVAMASAGYERFYDTEDQVWRDTEKAYLLDDAGNVWVYWFYTIDGAFSAHRMCVSSDLPALRFDEDQNGMYCSMAVAEDGAVYLSQFDGDCSHVYRMEYLEASGSFASQYVGDFGQAAPVILYRAAGGGAHQSAMDSTAAEPVDWTPAGTVTSREAPAAQAGHGGLHAARGEADAAPAGSGMTVQDQVHVQITASEASANGLLEVTWDPTQLRYISCVSTLRTNSVQADEGRLVFGFAAAAPVATEELLATLTFQAVQDATCDLHVQVNTLERNGDMGLEETELLTVDPDTARHDWGQWEVTAEATCFQEGEQTRTCSLCGKTESQTLPVNSDHCPSKAFYDVNAEEWYHEAVDDMLTRGLMQGTGTHTFSPELALTRGMLVTILYRMEEEPGIDGATLPFTDVAEGRYYTEAVTWASQNGIVKGMTETAFAPEMPITREQLATILYRYAGFKGAKLEEKGELSAFPDGASVKPYAREAMAWAVGTGLIQGIGHGGVTVLAPQGSATRAQVAAVLMRYLEKTAEAS